MKNIDRLFSNNEAWAEQMLAQDDDYFNKLATGQQPEYLWIGCADSRVPAERLVGLQPGELFVHRNVANQVIYTDFNAFSVIQYAVEVLKVKYIIICGHYQCGGVQAALSPAPTGVIGQWLQHIRELYLKHAAYIDSLPAAQQGNALSELNVAQQVYRLAHSPVIQNAWSQGQVPQIHGYIFNIADGKLNDLALSCTSLDEMTQVHEDFLQRYLPKK